MLVRGGTLLPVFYSQLSLRLIALCAAERDFRRFAPRGAVFLLSRSFLERLVSCLTGSMPPPAPILPTLPVLTFQ